MILHTWKICVGLNMCGTIENLILDHPNSTIWIAGDLKMLTGPIGLYVVIIHCHYVTCSLICLFRMVSANWLTLLQDRTISLIYLLRTDPLWLQNVK